MFHGDHVTYLLFQLVCQRIGHHGLPRTGRPVKQHHHACSNMRPMGQAIDKRSNGTAIGHSTRSYLRRMWWRRPFPIACGSAWTPQSCWPYWQWVASAPCREPPVEREGEMSPVMWAMTVLLSVVTSSCVTCLCEFSLRVIEMRAFHDLWEFGVQADTEVQHPPIDLYLEVRARSRQSC